MPTVNDANGTPWRVTDEGMALVKCMSLPMSAHAADDGDAYSVIIAADPNGTDQDFFYLKNNDDMPLRIYKIEGYTGSATADQIVSIKLGVTGTPTSGTAITPVNAVAGSGSVADVTCEYRDEDLALTGGSTYCNLYLDKDTTSRHITWDFPAEITLLKNQALVFNNDTDPVGTDVNLTVYFYFHENIE